MVVAVPSEAVRVIVTGVEGEEANPKIRVGCPCCKTWLDPNTVLTKAGASNAMAVGANPSRRKERGERRLNIRQGSVSHG